MKGKVTQKEEETVWGKIYIDAERKEQETADFYVKANSLGERFKSECGPTKQEKQDLLHTKKNKKRAEKRKATRAELEEQRKIAKKIAKAKKGSESKMIKFFEAMPSVCHIGLPIMSFPKFFG